MILEITQTKAVIAALNRVSAQTSSKQMNLLILDSVVFVQSQGAGSFVEASLPDTTCTSGEDGEGFTFNVDILVNLIKNRSSVTLQHEGNSVTVESKGQGRRYKGGMTILPHEKLTAPTLTGTPLHLSDSQQEVMRMCVRDLGVSDVLFGKPLTLVSRFTPKGFTSNIIVNSHLAQRHDPNIITDTAMTVALPIDTFQTITGFLSTFPNEGEVVVVKKRRKGADTEVPLGGYELTLAPNLVHVKHSQFRLWIPLGVVGHATTTSIADISGMMPKPLSKEVMAKIKAKAAPASKTKEVPVLNCQDLGYAKFDFVASQLQEAIDNCLGVYEDQSVIYIQVEEGKVTVSSTSSLGTVQESFKANVVGAPLPLRYAFNPNIISNLLGLIPEDVTVEFLLRPRNVFITHTEEGNRLTHYVAACVSH